MSEPAEQTLSKGQLIEHQLLKLLNLRRDFEVNLITLHQAMLELSGREWENLSKAQQEMLTRLTIEITTDLDELAEKQKRLQAIQIHGVPKVLLDVH